jgi:hypothetical protein
LGQVLEWLSSRGARFIAAFPGLDTDKESGRLALRTIIEVASWERLRLVERTPIGMRAARRKGPASLADYPMLLDRIAGMRANGMTLQAIADELNAERAPTIRGGAKWRPSSVEVAAGHQRPPMRYGLDVWSRAVDGYNAGAPEVISDIESALRALPVLFHGGACARGVERVIHGQLAVTNRREIGSVDENWRGF